MLNMGLSLTPAFTSWVGWWHLLCSKLLSFYPVGGMDQCWVVPIFAPSRISFYFITWNVVLDSLLMFLTKPGPLDLTVLAALDKNTCPTLQQYRAQLLHWFFGWTNPKDFQGIHRQHSLQFPQTLRIHNKWQTRRRKGQQTVLSYIERMYINKYQIQYKSLTQEWVEVGNVFR
jgi:hypothetical protein